MLAYGGDVQVANRVRNLIYKHALAQDYPEYVRGEKRTLEELEYLSKHADHIVSGVDWVDYMPWWDRINVGHFAIDMKQWQPLQTRQRRDKVVVLHAPNHREIKGTRFLIRACEELAAEGVPVELELLERVPNTKVHERMAYADIVADQFIIGWYAMFAIEAMSMGKPVLCYLQAGPPRAPHALRDGRRLPAREHAAAPDQGRAPRARRRSRAARGARAQRARVRRGESLTRGGG